MTKGNRLVEVARENRQDCQSIVRKTGELSEVEDFSPDAYNRISAPILSALFEVIERLAQRWPVPHNLGLSTYTEIHTRLCRHYFRAYESLRGLEDPRAGIGEPPSSDGRSRISRIQGAGRHALRGLWTVADALRERNQAQVVYSGSTTVPRFGIRRRLRGNGIQMTTPNNSHSRVIEGHGEQVDVLHRGLGELHRDLAHTMGVSPETLPLPPRQSLQDTLDRWECVPSLPDDGDLLVTGPLGDYVRRSLALDAIQQDVPILTVHHGAHHLIFEEPYYPLYEGTLPDDKLVYGGPEIQREEGTSGPRDNLKGEAIGLTARTDPTVRNVRSRDKIDPAAPIDGKRVVYFSSNFQRTRYGPYRDVHPIIYFRWKRALLEWLESQTGRTPAVRPHPKRETTAYDPGGYPMLEGTLVAALEKADVIALDYPTTVLGPAAATSKPILFFDIALRRLHPNARERISTRCHTAEIDILDPEPGLSAMEDDLVRECRDEFTPVHSMGPDEPEVETAARWIREYLPRA